MLQQLNTFPLKDTRKGCYPFRLPVGFRLLTLGQLQPFLKTPQPLSDARSRAQTNSLKDLFIEMCSMQENITEYTHSDTRHIRKQVPPFG